MKLDEQINEQEFDSKTDNLGKLLANLPFEKTHSDYSASVFKKLKAPLIVYNPYWELVYLFIVFGLLVLSSYLFIRTDESDYDTTGIKNGISGIDKSMLLLILFAAAAMIILFFRRYQKFKKRITEIKNNTPVLRMPDDFT